MISRRTILGLFAYSLASQFSVAHAAETEPFTTAAFEAAQKSGKSILVDIWASWCPTCKAQGPILEKLQKDNRFKDIVVFRVDFDKQVDVVQSFGAQMQSTLIVFKGMNEVRRSVGDTDPASIEYLLLKAI
jgi:thioredoxin 1